MATKAIRSEDAKRYVALRPFTYAATELGRGQIFTLVGSRNDEKLLRLRYIRELSAADTTYTCAECGATFAHMGGRDEHGRGAHRARALNPRDEDRLDEQQERMLQEAAPLALENTIASRA